MSQSTIFQSCRDGAIASWVINQYFRGVKCLAQGHNTAAVGFERSRKCEGCKTTLVHDICMMVLTSYLTSFSAKQLPSSQNFLSAPHNH